MIAHFMDKGHGKRLGEREEKERREEEKRRREERTDTFFVTAMSVGCWGLFVKGQIKGVAIWLPTGTTSTTPNNTVVISCHVYTS